jgi:hypothetical protein
MGQPSQAAPPAATRPPLTVGTGVAGAADPVPALGPAGAVDRPPAADPVPEETPDAGVPP